MRERLTMAEGLQGGITHPVLVKTLRLGSNRDRKRCLPVSLAVLPDYTVAIVDQNNSCLKMVDLMEERLTGIWPTKGNKPSGVTYLSHLQKLVVCDEKSGMLHLHNIDGQPGYRWGSKFNEPGFVRQTTKGDIIINDQYDSTIHIYESNWNKKFDLNPDIFDFHSINYMALNSKDQLLVTDMEMGTLKIFDPEQQLRLKTFQLSQNAMGVCVDKSDTIYVADVGQSEIYKIEGDFMEVDREPECIINNSVIRETFVPYDIAILPNSDRYLLVLDTAGGGNLRLFDVKYDNSSGISAEDLFAIFLAENLPQTAPPVLGSKILDEAEVVPGLGPVPTRDTGKSPVSGAVPPEYLSYTPSAPPLQGLPRQDYTPSGSLPNLLNYPVGDVSYTERGPTRGQFSDRPPPIPPRTFRNLNDHRPLPTAPSIAGADQSLSSENAYVPPMTGFEPSAASAASAPSVPLTPSAPMGAIARQFSDTNNPVDVDSILDELLDTSGSSVDQAETSIDDTISESPGAPTTSEPQNEPPEEAALDPNRGVSVIYRLSGQAQGDMYQSCYLTSVVMWSDTKAIIVDRNNCALKVLNIPERRISGVMGVGKLKEPHSAVYIKHLDKMAVTDRTEGCIIVFQRDGNCSKWGCRLKSPEGIAYADEKIYVCENMEFVNVYSKAFQLLTSLNIRAGGLTKPFSVAISTSKYTFVSDDFNKKVLAFNDVGNLAYDNVDNSNFKLPKSLCVDKLGRVYVTDCLGQSVIRLSPLGKYIDTPVKNMFDSENPYALAVTKNLEMIVTTGQGGVYVIDLGEGRQSTMRLDSNPRSPSGVVVTRYNSSSLVDRMQAHMAGNPARVNRTPQSSFPPNTRAALRHPISQRIPPRSVPSPHPLTLSHPSTSYGLSRPQVPPRQVSQPTAATASLSRYPPRQNPRGQHVREESSSRPVGHALASMVMGPSSSALSQSSSPQSDNTGGLNSRAFQARVEKDSLNCQITSMATLDLNHVLILDTNNNVVKFMNIDSGKVIRETGRGALQVPTALAFLQDKRRIVICDSNTLKLYDPAGTFVMTWGRKLSKDTLLLPSSICTTIDGNIVVASPEKRHVQVFASNWQELFLLTPSPGCPVSVVSNDNGNIFVLDSQSCTVYKYDSGGVFVSTFGSHGMEKGEWMNPKGLAIDSSGVLYVVDEDTFKITAVDSDFETVRELKVQIRPASITVVERHSVQLLVIAESTGLVDVINVMELHLEGVDSGGDKAEIVDYVEGLRAQIASDTEPSYIVSMCMLDNRRIAAVDQTNHNIKVFSLETGQLDFMFGKENLEKPSAIILKPGEEADTILVCDITDNGSIKCFDLTGTFLHTVVTDVGQNIRAVTFDRRGVLLISVGTKVRTYNGSTWGELMQDRQVGERTHLSNPQGIAVGKNGKVVVADEETNSISIYQDSGGNLLYQYGAHGRGPEEFLHPNGVCIDKHGSIFVADWGNSRVHRLSRTGHFQGFVADREDALEMPMALCIAGGNHIAVSEMMRGTIRLFPVPSI